MRTSLWDPPSSGPQYSESYPMALDGPTREIPTLERTPPSSDEMPLATLPSASLLSSEPPLSFAYPFQIASQHTSPTVEGQEMVPNHSAEISDGKPGGRSAIHDNLPLFKNSQPVSGETSSSVIPVNIKSVFPHSPTDRPFGKVSYGTRAESSIGDARHVSDKTAHWWHSFMMNTQKLPADDPSKVLFSRLTNAFFSKSVDLSSVPVSLPSDYSIIPRPLYLRSDLFFHSEVVLHLLNLFCRVFYPENQDLHYHRILVRHAQGFVDRSFLIAIMMTVTPMSSHEVFCDIPLRQASTHYHKRLVTMLPSVIESNSLDSVFVLGALSDYELGRGHTETSFYLSTTVIRKFQQWRVHIMDHPSPPPRLFADESVPDLPTSTDPLLRENYRNIWYSCIGRVVLSSLIFGHLPGVHNRDIYVNRQMPASQYLDLKDRSLADLHSPFYTDPKYPTFIMRPLNFHHNNPRFMNINAITHRVAELRYYRTTDPELWFRERTILNQKLEEWAQRKDIGNELSLVELQNMGKRFRYREYMIWRLHSLVWYYITLIFLNYPGEMNPWPFSPLEVIRQVEKRWNVDLDLEPAHPTSPPSPYPASPDSCSSNSEPPSNPLHELDPTGEVFMECGKLTWEGVKGLHRTIQRSLAVPNFFHNTLFVGALYAAGVVCILSVHTSKDPSTVGWARDFIEEIIDILSQVGELWVYNLDAARKLRQLLNVKSRRRYHITLTAQENLTNMV
ncbi:hypothetical protein IWQ62_005009 [Dispira parvispora]|uniref:Transcription factor domain-containing protein n=1 Tax=Dispira parvispora TaxID=1520584 RepID=A0A9W8ARM2_9FUNG|nr:hypothetical protein IWQ62_005009 [Dispira parvispora]